MSRYIKTSLDDFLALNENIITPPNIPNTLNFWHGGNLSIYDEDHISNKKDRFKYGAGLYFTSSYDVVGKYIKGSRKLYLLTVEKGVDINTAYLNIEAAHGFIKQYIIGSKRKEIISSMEKYIKDGKIKANIFNNIILNSEAIKATNTKYMRSFYVENGIDYEIIDNAFGWGEQMMVLYNMNKIVNTIQVKAGDKIETYNLHDK